MPTGIVTRYNDSAKAGFIETSTGSYPVSADDMEPKTQFEGARVEFDVSRAGDRDRAVNVTLRDGTRHDPKQRRFGDTR
jgi:cold shock CspA family protein